MLAGLKCPPALWCRPCFGRVLCWLERESRLNTNFKMNGEIMADIAENIFN